ncbi:hypothetical protein FXO37_19244 [Capsicum annuum]|nr:hypothetical protein FXO37_19244 [Capsicum annuum]
MICKEKPTLVDMRAWSSQTWKNVFGMNINEMYGDVFLFEFPNRCMAEQVLQGQWTWKKEKFNLERWSPMAGCVTNSIVAKETWIRAIGIPLHLWLQKVFYEIGQMCGVGSRGAENTREGHTTNLNETPQLGWIRKYNDISSFNSEDGPNFAAHVIFNERSAHISSFNSEDGADFVAHVIFNERSAQGPSQIATELFCDNVKEPFS